MSRQQDDAVKWLLDQASVAGYTVAGVDESEIWRAKRIFFEELPNGVKLMAKVSLDGLVSLRWARLAGLMLDHTTGKWKGFSSVGPILRALKGV